jgi:hypothetical protein
MATSGTGSGTGFTPDTNVDEHQAFVNADGTAALISYPDQDNSAVQRSTAGSVAPGQVAKLFTAKVATITTGITTIALYTVTTGKTFYLTDVSIFTDYASPIDGSIQAAGTGIFYFGTSTTSPVSCQGIETQPTATTAQALTLVLPQTTAVQHVWYNICGFEQ